MTGGHIILIALLAALLLHRIDGQKPTTVFANCVAPLPAYEPSVPTYGTIIAQSLITRGRPASIVIVQSTQDVAKAVRCARKAKLNACARSGGHALDGRSLCDNAVMIDLNKIRGISIDQSNVATIGSGATLGETYWQLHARGRWYSGGTCPNVGMGGYLLGGGHGPYDGRLGLGCDALEEVTMVIRDGDIIKANRTLRQGLFWAMCGVGGSQFGIITHFKMKTASSAFFDRAVVFRFKWTLPNVGELLDKYARFEPTNGDTWVRMVTSNNGGGMTGQGACFGVDNVAQCMKRLESFAFFNTPGREQIALMKARSALHVSGFFGPDGRWGNRFPPNLWRAYNNKRFTDGGKGNRNSDQSAYLSFGNTLPPRSFWQTYAEYCNNASLPSVRWLVCQVNLSKGGIRVPKNNAFPFRAATIQVHFSIGPSNDGDRKKAYDWMRAHFARYTVGVYVNYQDPELKASYPAMYWGKSLPALKALKAKYDPGFFFANPQPIPVV